MNLPIPEDDLPLFKDDRDGIAENDGRMRLQFLTQLQPEVRGLLVEFTRYSRANRLPRPVVTEVVRDEEAQVRIYVEHWQRCVQRLEKKDPTLQGADLRDATACKGLTRAQLVARARARFTWHWVACAVDLRTRTLNHYTITQQQQAAEWFRARCPKSEWEFLVHDVHGPHMHVARKDFTWRETFQQQQDRKGRTT